MILPQPQHRRYRLRLPLCLLVLQVYLKSHLRRAEAVPTKQDTLEIGKGLQVGLIKTTPLREARENVRRVGKATLNMQKESERGVKMVGHWQLGRMEMMLG